MKVLIIKMSSLGDVLHTLPALTDAGKAIDDIEFHWVVEESFAQLPQWHPLVRKIIPVAFRRLRKTPLKSFFSDEWKSFKKTLREENYDLVVDAQGLMKSAFISRFAKGEKVGFDKASLREPYARWFYNKTCAVDSSAHAVTRTRQLFARALGYAIPQTPADYAIDREAFRKQSEVKGDFILFLHGTTWKTKLWPETYWIALGKILKEKKVKVYLPWGNQEEKERAERIASSSGAEVLPKLSLNAMICVLAQSKAIIAVDTGLGHIAAALSVPTISLYGPTDPKRTGTMGMNQIHLAADFPCAPCLSRKCTYTKPAEVFPACFTTVAPGRVLEALQEHCS